ncbi:MAG: carboxypeptidase-like regulatory domain-containing protein [candidate division KSB1 bacterium]|nr:carboxypeptidase-like regulatory domain-containing protein [candidate division KSB1 bacterium]
MGYKTSNRPYVLFSVLVIALSICFQAGLFAATTGKIVGIVRDAETNETLPGVNVVVSGTRLGAATDLQGRYVILNVPVGVYEISASMIGYAKLVKTDVLVSMGRNTTLNFALKPTVIQGEQVVVSAERDIMHTEISYSQEVVTNEQITEAPAVRQLQDFVTKQAGVSGDLSIRGGSADQTGTMVDGFTFVNERMGTPKASIPLSAVEQVSVIKGGYNAEYGNFRSGMLEITTKKGDRKRYSGRLDASMNVPHMKRFGKSLYDPYNFLLRPRVDPQIAFIGTDQAWADNPYVLAQNATFVGWNKLAQLYNMGKSEAEQAAPLDLYLWNAWMHTTEPPFEKLAELGYAVPEELQQKFKDHTHEPEGSHSDYNIDFGFGGPIPVIGKYLGDATFYLSHNSNESYYTQPNSRPSINKNVSTLTIQSNLSKSLKLTLNGLYSEQYGMFYGSTSNWRQSGVIGNAIPLNNITNVTAGNEMYIFMPGYFSPMDNYTSLLGLKLTKTVNPKTFWNFSISGESHKTEAYPTWAEYIDLDDFLRISVDEFHENYSKRSSEPVAEFGPIKVNEMPYYYSAGSDIVDDFAHNQWNQPFGTTDRRFSRKSPAWFDSTQVQTIRLKFDINSQLTYHHLVKAGIDANITTNFEHRVQSYVHNNFGGHNVFKWSKKPFSAAVYVQDQITYEGVVANIGLRCDYYDPGGKWPQGDPFSADIFGIHAESTIEDYGLNEFEVWDSLGIMQPVRTHFTLSPRLGLSFPVTERSKYYFNYGHFRSLIPWHEQYIVRARPMKWGVQELGNPNLAPPRTISYETGMEYNLLDQFLIRISGYYKDVTGEHGSVHYENETGSVMYDSYLNNNYEDILGAEISVTKNYGRWITGWANFDFLYKKSGHVGRKAFYQDPSKEEQFGLYQGQESTLLPRPSFRANVTFHVPERFGLRILGLHPLGGWLISVMPMWRAGGYFTWNPLGKLHLQDNLQWPDYHKVDAKLGKEFEISGLHLEAYINVTNLFNNKHMIMNRGFCFDGSGDQQAYFSSLKLPIYNSSDFDGLRVANPGLYEPGKDKPGELRSDEKPYINDPNNSLWLFDQPRDIWFGLSLRF